MRIKSTGRRTSPTFLVIGAQKAGTTWLRMIINQHPEVTGIPDKEIHYFNKSDNYLKGKDWYIDFFVMHPHTKAIGEYTPNYFWTYDENESTYGNDIHEEIPKLVYDFNPQMRLIVILRNPVNRAISAYYHHIKKGRISPNEKILNVIHLYGILSMGYYDIHLKNWLKFFPFENFLILIYERDICGDNKADSIKKVFKHIGVDDTFIPRHISKIVNSQRSYFDIRAMHCFSKSGKIISCLVPKFIKNLECWNIKVCDSDKKTLNTIFKSHNIELENLLGYTLPW